MINLFKRNRLFVICSFLALALFFFVSVHPAQSEDEYRDRDDHYVATNGDDANPGTQSSPWKTIQFAIDHVEPGDIIYVRGGIYNESVALHQPGLAGSPITLTAYGDESVTISGGEAPALTALWDGTQYWIIEGFTLDSNAEYTIQLSVWDAFWSDHMIIRNNYIRGAVIVSGSYNIFEGNEVDGSQHKGSEDGVQESQEISHHNIYRNNHIHHFSSRGIWSMHRTHDSVFENNYIHHIENGFGYEQGIDLDGFASVVWRHIVRNNHIHDVDYVPIALENVFDSVVENNIVHDSGIGISDINYGGPVGDGWGTDERCEVGGEKNQYGDTDGDNDCRGDITGNLIRQNLIYNVNLYAAIQINYAGGVKIQGNTIYCGGNKIAGILTSIGLYTPELEMRGNIISECGWGAIDIQDADPLTEDSNNLLYRSDGGDVYLIEGSGYNLSQYQSMFGRGQGSVEAAPLFVEPSNNDFHLQSNSPAIDAGVDTGLTADIDGNPRPRGLGYDIGALEYSEPWRVYLPTLMMGH